MRYLCLPLQRRYASAAELDLDSFECCFEGGWWWLDLSSKSMVMGGVPEFVSSGLCRSPSGGRLRAFILSPKPETPKGFF